MINLDYTLLIQAVNFFLFLLILNFLFFKPLLQAIERRNRQIEESAKEAGSLSLMAEEQLGDYKAKFEEARKKAVEVRDKVRKEGMQKEAEILEEARKKSADYLKHAQMELEKEVSAVKSDLSSRTKEIADLMSRKVLGRS